MSLLKGIARFFGAEEEQQAPVRNTGRNDVCWCGSGKKYKKCHLEEDENKARKACAPNCGSS